MFKNPGKILQVIGKIFFWLFVVGGTIIGLALGLGVDEVFLVFIPSGFVAGFLIALPICAFGTMVENSEKIKANTEELKSTLGSVRSAADSAASTLEQTADVCMDIYNSINK